MEQKKKLLYITRYYTDQEFHLKKKFDGQIAAFKNLGFDTFFIGIGKNYLFLIHNEDKTIYGKTHYNLPHYIHTQLYNDLHKVAIKAIYKIGFDYVYWRSAPLWRSSCKVAEAVNETGGKLLLEIPTFPNREAPLNNLRKLFSIYSNYFRKRFELFVDYYVVIGEDANGEYKGKPAINIENGIDINGLSVRKPIIDNDSVHILALASMSYWHGYDRLLKSLAEYNGNQNVIIHMVGGNEGGSLLEWKELAKELGIDNKVVFHGGLYGRELDEMVNHSDLGVAALAVYRKGFSYISELKTREYTARCLPFILAAEDVIISKSPKKFWVQITNDSQIPDMEEIISFALRMRKDQTIIPYMRDFAEKNLTWSVQYKKLFDEIEKLQNQVVDN